jgi:hypothetical protein
MSNPRSLSHNPPAVSGQAVVQVASKPESQGWLVYQAHANGGAVFASAEDAIRSEAIHGALEESKTWGEFKSRLPEGEWDTVEERLSEHYGYPDDGEDDEADEDRPRWEDACAPFSAEEIPGFSDGDYPPWLQQCLDEVLPAEVLAQYAERKSSIFNGDFWFIPNERADEVAEALRQRGYEVEEAGFLRFF